MCVHMSASLSPAAPLALPREISREDLALLPVRRYEGEVVMVASPKDFDRAWEDLAQEAATGRAVYLFQLAKMDFSKVVGGLFAEPSIVKPGISVADDLKKLKQVFPFEEASVLDLGTVAKRHGLKQTGL